MNKAFEKILERLEERTDFLSDCTKYGNKDAKQQEKSYSTMMLYEVAYLVDDLKEIVKQVAEEYNDGWIPCSERLPKESELVIIYAESIARGGSIMVVACLHNGFWFAQTSSDTFGLTGIGQFNVIAWQPLPEPYKECDKYERFKH